MGQTWQYSGMAEGNPGWWKVQRSSSGLFLPFPHEILDSELFELMHQNGDYTHFYFCYRWFLLDFKRGKKWVGLGIMAHAYNPSTPEHSRRVTRNSRPVS